MDIRCAKCGEPWDMDELHYVEDMSFDQARQGFYKQGCEVFGTTHSQNKADPALSMLQDLLGDDIDGLAALTEDFGL
jgi:hypothetical protein